MISPGTTVRLARADVLERTRRYSFLITLAAVVYAAYVFVPPNDSSYTTVSLGGHRGIYNSAWIGTMIAMMTNAFLSLAGFYLVKNSIRRDISTRVGEVIAATQVSKFRYLFAKALSDFAVLSSMVAVVGLAAIVMQVVRGEDPHVNLWRLLSPFVIVTLPMMAVVAATAILFESVAFLRGGLGNVVFFFLWIFTISPTGSETLDLFGFQESINSMQVTAARTFSDYDLQKKNFSLGFSFKDSGDAYHLSTFVWEGTNVTVAMILRRLAWIAIALGLIFASGFLFRRFDETGEGGAESSRRRSFYRRKRKQAERADLPAETAVVQLNGTGHPSLTAPAGVSNRLNFGPVLVSECKLILKGVSRWWLLVAGVLFVLGLALPIEAIREVILPLTFIWPILLWSSLGSRESQYSTEQLMFSCPHPIRNQFLAMWSAGVLLAILAGGGVGLRFLIGGEWQNLLGLFVGVLFIPSLALAAGVWTSSGKMFEIVYLILWYIGPMNKLPELDFLGSTSQALQSGQPGRFLVITVMLLALAILGRRRQMLQY